MAIWPAVIYGVTSDADREQVKG